MVVCGDYEDGGMSNNNEAKRINCDNDCQILVKADKELKLMTSPTDSVAEWMTSLGFRLHTTFDGEQWVHNLSNITTINKKTAAFFYHKTAIQVHFTTKGNNQ